MKAFIAKKEYYIHNFEAIKDWFGGRGFEVSKEDLLEWCYDGEYLFYTTSDSADECIQPDDPKDVVVCKFDSIYFEVSDEISYQDSPFANKVVDKNIGEKK